MAHDLDEVSELLELLNDDWQSCVHLWPETRAVIEAAAEGCESFAIVEDVLVRALAAWVAKAKEVTK